MNAKTNAVPHASWEDPELPFRPRLRKYWRQMLLRLWGPTGSVVFHVSLLALLVTFTIGPDRDTYKPPETTYLPFIPATQPLDPVLPPPSVATPTTRTIVEPSAGLGVGEAPGSVLESGAGGVTAAETAAANTLTDLPGNSPLIDPHAGRLILAGLIPGGLDGRGAISNAVAKWNPGTGIARSIEDAVVRALRWLEKNQDADGSWPGTSKPAMTAMGLLAFLGHGEKPGRGEFGPVVRRAIDYLIASQEADGLFKGRDGNNYTQAIAAYALSEAYALTQHPDVKRAAEKAVAVIVRGQHGTGGFNYNLNADNRDDTSYMGWCAQALKAAKMAKLEVPGLDQAIRKAVMGFRMNAHPAGGFGYTGPGQTGLSGAGALCMQLLGAGAAREVRATMAFLAPATFSFEKWDHQPYSGTSPLYYWYYVTQAKYHDGEETFKAWNRQFMPELLRTQIRERNALEGPGGGRADVGHWESPSKGEHTGGVVQDTCLCTLMLEVYYRYLPSYQHVEPAAEDLASAPKADGPVVHVRP